MIRYPRVLPVGDAALTVELGEAGDAAANERVRALDRALAESPFPGLLETIPCLRSLLVCFDPAVVSSADVGQAVRPLLGRTASRSPHGERRVIPTVYGGADGPDLPEVAARCGLSAEDVIARHASAEYTAAMVGFMPGFAYLWPLPPELRTARRTTPRLRVPEGSVAVAGEHTGIYPAACPGGWNLIGRTSLRLFDPFAQPPVLIRPGDRVRFERVGALPPREPRPARAADSPAAVEVLEPGLLTTVQDAGRHGHRRFGVSAAGAVDAEALRAANALVGNPPGAAGLECTIEGPVLRFLATTSFALTGAGVDAVLERADLGPWPVPHGERVLGRAGNVLRMTGRHSGCRIYVAFAGGLDVPVVLGSRSTDLVGGFGGCEGRALRAGDRLGLGRSRGGTTTGPAVRAVATGGAATVRVVLGPQSDHFDRPTVDRFLSATWAVLATSDRVGCRLSGPRLEHRGATEIPTDGMVPGCVQVPPDGQPIVMLCDGPTTGGYPKIATAVTADLPLLAQLVPGEGSVRFEEAGP